MQDPSRPVTGYPAPPYTQPHSTSTATAYPYNAPPPPHYNPNPNANANAAYPYPYPYHPPPYPSRRATFLRRFLAAMIALFIIMGTIIFIVWLILRPRLPDFSVASASISSFNVSGSQLSGNWDFTFAVRNPNNKMSISYDRIESFISYKSAVLSQTSIAPFYQGTKNDTTARATFAALGAYVGGSEINELNAERARGSVSFTVKVLARVRFKSGAWKARRRFLSAVCNNIPLGLTSNASTGSLVGGSRECRVGL